MIITTNQKYKITEITHDRYPFLHRIQALRDIGSEVKAGDLGGFVENEGNLSSEAGDDAWIFDQAIACGDAYVDMCSYLRDEAIACGRTYVSHGSVLSGHARAEDDSYIRGAILTDEARVSGFGKVLHATDALYSPLLSGKSAVYGSVCGNVCLTGTALVIRGEEIDNNAPDMLVIDGEKRSIRRDPSRDELFPKEPEQKRNRPKNKEKGGPER